MGLSRGFVLQLCYLACVCFIFQTATNVQAQSQQKRSSRITSSRSFGTNVKASASNGINFDCPEEFGYYPHPTDCTQYYVCVFGGALLESCTGGLMYSHELQTCDWPRNVGCEVVDSGAASLDDTGNGGGTRAGKQQQQQQQQQSINSQHVPSRIRFGSAFSSPAATTQRPKATVPPQYHRQPPQVVQAQVQSLPQHAGTVTGARGQPKPFDTQEDIAKLYADAHETLPPVEEEESDRQQRVYRGQPSTVSQVQRDRDGIIHQANINAIPNHGKIGSYTFGSQFRPDSSSPSSPQSQPPVGHYVQQQRPPTAVIVEAIPSIQSQNQNQNQNLANRNYYNTSALLNHAGYESQANIHHHQLHQQQQAEQQQQIALQHQQQHQQQQQQQQQQPQQAPQQSNQEQSSYEQYYSVYDDDLDLYRDIEYQQQQEQQQQQYQPQPQQAVRQQPVQQSTYRPLEILTTPAPQVPLRETYQPQEKPTYNNQQSLIYNTDYDEDLLAQIEQDNVYDQPTRSPTRSKTHANKFQKNQRSQFINPQQPTAINTPPTTTFTPIQRKPTTLSQKTTTITPISQSFPSSQYLDSDETFVAVGAKSHSYPKSNPNIQQNQNSPQTTNSPLSQPSLFNSRTVSDFETVSDASQNVHVHTSEPFSSAGRSFESSTTKSSAFNTRSKFLAAIHNVEDYAEGSRGNSVRVIGAKNLSHAKYSTNENTYNSNRQREEHYGKNSKDERQLQRFSDFEKPKGRLQSYVVSDTAPQSFKPLPTVKVVLPPFSEPEPILEFIRDDTSATSTTLRYPTNIVFEPKPFKYNLQTGSNGFSLRAQNTDETNETDETDETGKPIYERRPIATDQKLMTTSRAIVTPITSTGAANSPTQKSPFYDSYEDDIVPTTYAPPLRSTWRLGRTSARPLQQIVLETGLENDHVSSSGSEQSVVTTLKETSTVSPATSSSTTTTSTTPRTTTTTTTTTRTTTTTANTTPPPITTFVVSNTERAAQSYTPRTLTFKDNLIKTTGTPSQRFVSPYKSLETILQEKEDRYTGFNGHRSTVKPRYTSPTTPTTFTQNTSVKPVRSYFLITTPQRNLTDNILSTASTGMRNFSVSDTILNTFSNTPHRASTTTTTTTAAPTTEATTESTTPTTMSTVIVTAPIRVSQALSYQNLLKLDHSSINSETARPRGRSRYSAATVNTAEESSTYAPRGRYSGGNGQEPVTTSPLEVYPQRRKQQRARIAAIQGQRNALGTNPLKSREKYENYKAEKKQQQASTNTYGQSPQKTVNRKPIENESTIDDGPRAEALVRQPIDGKQDNSIESAMSASSSSSTEQQVGEIKERPPKYLFSNKYRQQTKDRTLAESLQNAGYITSSTSRTKFDPASVLEQLQLFLAGDSDESSAQQFVDDFSEREISAAVKEIKNLYTTSRTKVSTMPTTSSTSTTTATTTTTTTTTHRPPTTTTTTTLRPTTTATPPTATYRTTTTTHSTPTTTTTFASNRSPTQNTYTQAKHTSPTLSRSTTDSTTSTSHMSSSLASASSTPASTAKSLLTPMRASRVNNAIKSSIAAAAYSAPSSPSASNSNSNSASATASQTSPAVGSANTARGNSIKAGAYATNAGAAVKCSDTTSNAKCNEIPSRTNSNNNRNRGSSPYAGQERDTPTAVTSNRGTHPPRTRPTLKPSGTIVSKAQEFVDIYRYPPSRPEPLYPQPTPDKTAAKCRKDVCLLPDCACGGKDIPGDLPVETLPQIVLITFDDSVNDLNKQLYTDLFEKGRVNPNGCPITATFYVSHEWTDYSQVQNLYAEGHEMASHTVSHSFGEQFSQKKWTREIAGQREILAAYGGVKLSDVRGMRAPFLSVGGNKMYKMLYDSNFTYDSSLPVYENRPPSWPYTFDYKIFHDCMIPPCPTRSYPGVWQVPMVMWQDLNGGRCSMGDACSNPSESEGVTKMIMKNFERHYQTNRAPFGLFYHAAWFTQPHHKEGFIKFLDTINQMPDVWIVTNWQMLQWVRDPTPISRINSFQPFQCDYSDRPKRCNNPKVCNLWHKSGVRYMKTCQPCPDIYPWTGKSGIRSSRIDNEIEDSTA